MSPSLYSFTLRLAVENSITFQSFSGFAACGIFYNLIRSVDGYLAESLHVSKRLAPWATSPLFIESPSPRIVYRRLPAPSIVSVSFTVMEDKLSNLFKEAILKPNLYVDLNNFKVRVVNVLINTYKFSEIASRAEPLSKRFSVKFLTPTAFRRSVYKCCPYCPYYVEYLRTAKEGRRLTFPCKRAVPCRGVIDPLPIPSLMFRNLARLWTTFSGGDLDVWGAVRWIENAVMIAGFPKPGIKTFRVYEDPATNKWIVGFVGTVRFSVREDVYREEYARIASALLRMAEMTNVGVRRTAGLGMIKYLPLKGGAS